jgi:hypothetical protein
MKLPPFLHALATRNDWKRNDAGTHAREETPMKPIKFKAGQIITLEHGSYSNFGYTGPLKVLRDFDSQSVVAKFRRGRKRGDIGEFIAWLSAEGYVEDTAAFKWILGDYWTLDPVGYVKPAKERAAIAAEERAEKKRKMAYYKKHPHMAGSTTGTQALAVGAAALSKET